MRLQVLISGVDGVSEASLLTESRIAAQQFLVQYDHEGADTTLTVEFEDDEMYVFLERP